METVKIDRDGSTTGLARIIVNFYTLDQKLAGRTLTEEDGYFNFIGLTPGTYNVRLDSAQLRRLNMSSSPDSLNFNIKANSEGDFIEGLDFNVRMKTTAPVVTAERITGKKDTTYMVIHEVVQEINSSSPDSYTIQMGAF